MALSLLVHPNMIMSYQGISFVPVSTGKVAPVAAPVVKWPDAGNHVWGVNRSGNIYYRAGKSGSWKQVSGGLKYVKVSADGNHVWGVNRNDNIYHRAGFSGSWQQIAGGLKVVGSSLIQTSEEAPVTGGGEDMDVSGPIVEMDTSGPLVAM